MLHLLLFSPILKAVFSPCLYTVEYYSAIKKNTFESVLMRWMKLEPIIQSEVSQKEKHQYSILMHIYRQSRFNAGYRKLGAGALE